MKKVLNFFRSVKCIIYPRLKAEEFFRSFQPGSAKRKNGWKYLVNKLDIRGFEVNYKIKIYRKVIGAELYFLSICVTICQLLSSMAISKNIT